MAEKTELLLKEGFQKESKQEEGCFDWIKNEFQRSDEDVQALSGQEAVLYLSFLKYTFYLFLALSVFGSLPLILVYLNLSHNEKCYPVNR